MKRSRILKVEYKPNCWIILSFPRRKTIPGAFYVETIMSFLYDNGEYAAEWEPQHGPIQVWHKCDKDSPGAREHYYYDFTDSKPGNSSQLAVERYCLPEEANAGNFDYIFGVLADWAKP